jgi:leucyl-tRNA synthetase
MRDLGLLSIDEPFKKLLTQGMVLNHIFERRTDKGGVDYFAPDEVEILKDTQGKITGAVCLQDGKPVTYSGIGTMSKSKRNGVDPQTLIDQYGADTARLFVMFASHPEATLEWSDTGVEGAHRFLRRLWQFAIAQKVERYREDIFQKPDKAVKKLRFDIHATLKQANFDYERIQYNTVVSASMKMLNALEAFMETHPADQPHETARAAITEALSLLLRVMYPIVPHTTYVLWNRLGLSELLGDLLDAPWPSPDEGALVQDEIDLVLQINGKLRGKLTVAADASKASIEQSAIKSAEVERYRENRPIKRVIVVEGRLVNVVI